MNSNATTLQRPDSASYASKQESEEYLKLLNTIQQQAEQISSLISTVNSQVESDLLSRSLCHPVFIPRRNKSNN